MRGEETQEDGTGRGKGKGLSTDDADFRRWGSGQEETKLRKGEGVGGWGLSGLAGGGPYDWALTGFPRQGSVPSLFLHDKKSEN